MSKPAPRTVYVPGYYQDVLMELYAALGVPVCFGLRASTDVVESKLSTTVNDRGHGVIALEVIGPTAGIELRQTFRDVQASGAVSVQISARLDQSGVPELCDTARELGFFFCGLGPAFADGADTLLLQWLAEPLETNKLQLFSEGATRLVSFIDRDRIKAQGFTA